MTGPPLFIRFDIPETTGPRSQHSTDTEFSVEGHKIFAQIAIKKRWLLFVLFWLCFVSGFFAAKKSQYCMA